MNDEVPKASPAWRQEGVQRDNLQIMNHKEKFEYTDCFILQKTQDSQWQMSGLALYEQQKRLCIQRASDG